jgi:hypothetical protein
LAVLLSVLLLALGAFSAEKSLTLSSPTSVNGTKLDAGEYKLVYTVNGTTADVQIKKGKETVATTSGQVVELQGKSSRDSVVTMSNGDGTSKLVEIQFANKKTAIHFGGESAAGN